MIKFTVHRLCIFSYRMIHLTQDTHHNVYILSFFFSEHMTLKSPKIEFLQIEVGI